MKIFFGAAIQGAEVRGTRAAVNVSIIKLIKARGHKVYGEHTTGKTIEQVAKLNALELGALPPIGIERSKFIRAKMIERIEDPKLGAAIFEVSLPSSGTGIEITHAYLRPRLGLPPIPILILYEQDYWPNGLSSMIRGLPLDQLPNVVLHDYDIQELPKIVNGFLKRLKSPLNQPRQA